MQKQILITGAAGFIGFHLAHYLKKRGERVIGYDNFNNYYSVKLKKHRAENLQKADVEVVVGDICDSTSLTKIIKKHQITHIVHLAAQAGVRYSLENPLAYIRSNIEGFTHILEICRQNGPISLIYASSSSVYGLNKKNPFSEKDITDYPVSVYGATKKSNELLAYTYHHLYHFPITGLRFFTVYGPWGRPDMAYYAFTQSILEGKPINLFNFGKMKRDFTYIDDIVRGTVAAIDLSAPCEIFNLGNHKPIELLSFIRILEQALGKKAQLEPKPMQKGDVLETFADIQHSQEKLGYYPLTSLEEGIPRFVEWFREYHQ
jgi:UDP-glucuronate 4-epimerase